MRLLYSFVWVLVALVVVVLLVLIGLALIFPAAVLPLVISGLLSVLAALVAGLIGLMMALVNRRSEPPSGTSQLPSLINQEGRQDQQNIILKH